MLPGDTQVLETESSPDLKLTISFRARQEGGPAAAARLESFRVWKMGERHALGKHNQQRNNKNIMAERGCVVSPASTK